MRVGFYETCLAFGVIFLALGLMLYMFGFDIAVSLSTLLLGITLMAISLYGNIKKNR